MQYIDKWSGEIIEAVKWDGNIETIKNNKWLYDAAKKEEIILAKNYINDKAIILFINSEYSLRTTIQEIKENDYIIKGNNGKIKFTESKIFKNSFKSLEENKSDYIYNKNKIMILQSKCFISNEKKDEMQKILSKELGMKVVIVDSGLEMVR